jgi:apolipoprotein N-acyltransferase
MDNCRCDSDPMASCAAGLICLVLACVLCGCIMLAVAWLVPPPSPQIKAERE